MRNRRWITLTTVVAVCVGAAFVRWHLTRSDPPQSELSGSSAIVQSPFVAQHLCAECHSEQADDYQSSGHADTFHLTTEAEIAKWLGGRRFEDPERLYTYEYHFDEATGLSVSIPQQFGDDRFQLPYVLGSGHNALTFLALIPDRFGDTIGIEHRVSLYRNGDGWDLDLTPGQRGHMPRREVEHFGQVMRGDKLASCVGCHTTQGEIVRQTIDGLAAHVGCQNCHGAGRQHVTAREQDAADEYTGVTQQSAREEVEMCGRCHRLGHSDPGVDLSPNDIRIVRFQSVGILQSRCFTASDGQLRCTSCHDPHKTVSHDVSHYVDRCLSCHGESSSTTCPVSPRTNCIRCHMPAIDVHRGIKFHDHWIRVRADSNEVSSLEGDRE